MTERDCYEPSFPCWVAAVAPDVRSATDAYDTGGGQSTLLVIASRGA